MANKYIYPGATYCGDGTASNAAASDGAAGAWNDLGIFHGTTPPYGVLADGDAVYIRSKDASGNDLSTTLTANITLGRSSVSRSSPISWILDNGDVWPGIDGTCTYTTTGAYGLIVESYNNIHARTHGAFIYTTSHTFSGSSKGVKLKNSTIEGWDIYIASTDPNGGNLISQSADGNSRVINCTGACPGRTTMVYASTSCVLTLINCTLTNESASYGGANSVFEAVAHSFGGDSSGRIIAINCKLNPTNVKEGKVLTNGLVEIYGGSYPYLRSFAATYQTAYGSGIGVDGRFGGMSARNGYIDSRIDGVYPTLFASVPDSNNTKWSWRIWPRLTIGISGYNFVCEVPISKLYTLATTASTLTVNFLVPQSFPLDAFDCWVDVSWTKESGDLTAVSTRDAGRSALASSDAGWSATSYGPVLLDKKKITVSLTGGVKQDTLVFVNFCVSKTTTSEQEVLFLCPDVQIT